MELQRFLVVGADGGGAAGGRAVSEEERVQELGSGEG